MAKARLANALPGWHKSHARPCTSPGTLLQVQCSTSPHPSLWICRCFLKSIQPPCVAMLHTLNSKSLSAMAGHHVP